MAGIGYRSAFLMACAMTFSDLLYCELKIPQQLSLALSQSGFAKFGFEPVGLLKFVNRPWIMAKIYLNLCYWAYFWANRAGASSGFWVMLCMPNIEPGLTGLGLGPFQLYGVRHKVQYRADRRKRRKRQSREYASIRKAEKLYLEEQLYFSLMDRCKKEEKSGLQIS